MPEPKTLYVVGAGASSEAGLPTGNQLKQEIAKLLDIRFSKGRYQSGDEHIISAFQQHARLADTPGTDINPYLQTARKIRDAIPQAISIDNYIDTQKGDKYIELCGKLAIVLAILNAERKSLLFLDRSNAYNKINFESLEKTWYAKFWMLLTENCQKEDIEKRLNSISLIVFNYDRCIEHFLYNSLQNYYGFPPGDAGKLVNSMEIYHPYGVIGGLSFQNNGKNIDFGEKPECHNLLELAEQIKTFTEGTDPSSSEILSIRKNMSEADHVVFLGFAYHSLNMQLMAPADSDKPTAYYGTAFGISDSNCKIIIEKLKTYKSSSPLSFNINNKLNCVSLFDEYWLSLSQN